jgi:hypothetical protein
MHVTFSFAHVIRAVIVAVSLPALAYADAVTVTTSGGTTTDTIWTVADPTAGDYTVTVSGANRSTGGDGNNYYRNSSNSGEDDRTITWTVSGLDTDYYISSFSLGTAKIVPSQGSGSSWTYVTTLSGTDIDTAAAVTSSQTFANAAGPLSPPMSISGDFGTSPAFTLLIDEQTPLSTRTIGTYNFTITAAPVPEPASIGLITLGAAALLTSRRRRCR